MSCILNLPKELQLIAETELNEVPSRLLADIDHIRKWISKQSHLKARTDDNTIVLFLRSCKFSLEKTKRRIELFYSVKTAFKSTFTNRDPFMLQSQEIFNKNLFAILPTTSNSPVCVLICLQHADPDVISLEDALKFATMVFDIILREYIQCSVHGQALLVDFQNLPFGYLAQLTPSNIKKIISCLENAYPSRVKTVHCINVNPIFNPALQILKSLVPKKISDRIFVYTPDATIDIQKYFPSSILPLEYGGEAGSIAALCVKFQPKMESYHKWFIEDEQYGTTEDKTALSYKLGIDISCMDGSFRKLNVD